MNLKSIILSAKSLLMAAVLTLAACTDEPVAPTAGTQRDIFYTVSENGSTAFLNGGTTAHLDNDAQWDALLDKFCDYAQNGQHVIFCSENNPQAKGSTEKAPTSISTADRNELKQWMKDMEKEGKTVNVTYNPDSGLWNGTAYANLGSHNTTAETQAFTGSLAFVATPNIQIPAPGGVVLALQCDGETYILTLQGMMIWFETEDSDSTFALLQEAEIALQGVAGEYTDLEGNTFKTIDLATDETIVDEI